MTKKVHISKIQENKKNPRVIKGYKFEKLVKSIKDFPKMMELRPIIVNEQNIILGGNMRYKAAVEAGLKEVHVKVAKGLTVEQKQLFGINKLNICRSTLPAITHIDYSARVQTVSKKTNPRYYNLINAFKKRTNCPLIVNTSFNVRGEPIVCTPQDAYRCFMRTEMDVLVLENQILFKKDQPKIEKDETWKQEFELD